MGLKKVKCTIVKESGIVYCYHEGEKLAMEETDIRKVKESLEEAGYLVRVKKG
jgi:predicted transcriptional regulator of viral defense system